MPDSFRLDFFPRSFNLVVNVIIIISLTLSGWATAVGPPLVKLINLSVHYIGFVEIFIRRLYCSPAVLLRNSYLSGSNLCRRTRIGWRNKSGKPFGGKRVFRG